MNEPCQLWDTSRTAAYIGIAPRVLQRWCRKGKIRFGRAGGQYRFRQEDADRAVFSDRQVA